MKKTIVVAIGLVLAGCQSTPEKQAAAEPEVVKPVVVKSEPTPAKAEVVPIAPVAQQIVAAEAVKPVVVAQVAPETKLPVSEKVEAAVAVKPAPTEPPKNISASTMAMDPRMDKIVKLIYSSSGARQVMSSDNAAAHEYHAKAKSLYEQATQAGEKSEVSRLLNESVKAMYTAIRSAGRDEVLADKRKQDFDKLKRSIDTFMEQHERISEEKGAGAEGVALREQVKLLVAKADGVFPQRPDDAKVILRESFEMLRNSIEQMREGETLVRSLNFATKKDEYDYELEKFKSQRLLVDVLLESKRESSPYVAKKFDEFIGKAEADRSSAEAAAAQGDYDTGVKLLEEGRKWIVRALRTGGIYVPG